jgi:lipoate-protein ligase A
MKFAVYQIQMTKAISDAVNAGEIVPSFEAKNKMNIDFSGNKIGGLASDAFDAGYYTHVANIEAEDYNDCFEVGNIGPDENIERLGRMSSLSVGDVIVAEDGTVAVIAPMGFVAFSHNPKVTA